MALRPGAVHHTSLVLVATTIAGSELLRLVIAGALVHATTTIPAGAMLACEH